MPRFSLAPARARTALWLGLALAGAEVAEVRPLAASERFRATAVVETAPALEAGDSVDDPAIWVDPADPSRSVVIGANHGGDTVEVYDLSGRRLQRLELGGANDVDLRPDFPLGGRRVPLVAVIGGGELRFFRLDPDSRTLTDVTKGGAIRSASAHGICLYHSRVTGTFHAFRITRFGPVDQFELVDDGGRVAVRTVREFDVEPRLPVSDGGRSALEPCVADDEAGHLFVAEEEYGIWRYGAEPTDPASPDDRVVVDTLVSGGGHIVPQVEGLAIVHDPHGEGFLIASDQGDHTFNVYRRLPPHDFVRKVEVATGDHADGCDRTDGIEVTAADLGPPFSRGLFVCQDNANRSPAAGNQNFKYVPLEQVVPLAEPTGPAPPPPGRHPHPAPAPGSPPSERPARPEAGDRPGSGYWMLDAAGEVYGFGEARHHGRATPAAPAVDIEPTPSGNGYWGLDVDGGVAAHRGARHHGEATSTALAAGERLASLSATPSGGGYWLFTDRGRVLAFGDAVPRGDMSRVSLNGRILDSVATPGGGGYYMVGADGGIFAFGDARFHGSMGGVSLNAPVQSLVPDPDGAGYWLVAADGGVFAFDTPFRGSMGAARLNAPVTGMVAFGNGYLMVGADGGIFNFSDRPFHGSLGDRPPAHPIAAVAALS